MSAIATNLQAVRERIAKAARAAGRDLAEITLLAVSKTKPLADILCAADAGQTAFGENYAQEGVDKMNVAVDRALDWHFIGPLQSNKTRLVAEHYSWVHSVERLKIAQRLASQRPTHLPQRCRFVCRSMFPAKQAKVAAPLIRPWHFVRPSARSRVYGYVA
jgi:pyridoxal phosphate enzyme (YggS family)